MSEPDTYSPEFVAEQTREMHNAHVDNPEFQATNHLAEKLSARLIETADLSPEQAKAWGEAFFYAAGAVGVVDVCGGTRLAANLLSLMGLRLYDGTAV